MPKLTAVVLCAGIGSRLGDLTKDKPKALQEVNGKPIVQYDLAWMRTLKADRIIVVGGYRIDQLREVVQAYAPEALVVENPAYATTQRMSSLWCAKDHIIGDLIAFDGDYIYSTPVAEQVLARTYDNVAVHSATGKSPYTEQDVIVTIDEHRHLKDIYKTKGTVPLEGVHQEYFNSLLYCPEKHLPEYWQIAEDVIAHSETGLVHLEDVILKFAQKNPVDVVSFGDPTWMEIDNPEEFKNAEAFIQKYGSIVPV